MTSSAFRFEIDEIDDTGDFQQVKGRGFANEELTQVHRVMPFGLFSSPPKGSHGIGIPLGSRDRMAVIGGEHQDLRPKNQPAGSTVLYGANGEIVSLIENKMRFVASQESVIVAGGVTFTIKGGQVHSSHVVIAPQFLIG